MTDTKRNILLHISAKILESAAYAVVTGTLIQVFLNALGFSASQIYLHTTLNQAAQIAVTMTCSRVGDRGKFFRRYGLTVMGQGALYLCYIPMCIHAQADLSAYLLLLGMGVLSSAVGGVAGLISYKLPYLVFRTEDYGTVTAVGGILSALVSMGMGVLMAALSARYSYQVIMLWAIPAAVAVLLFCGLLRLWYRPLIDPKTVQEENPRKKADFGAIWQVLRQPLFYQLAIPNVFRGFAGGIVGVIAVVAAADLGYSEKITATLVSVFAAANLVGYVLFGVLSRRMSPRYTVLLSGLSFLCLPLLLIPGQPILFLCLAAALTVGHTIEMEAVPALLLRAVSGKIAGPYNAYRLILTFGGSLLATALASGIPSSVMLPLAMGLQLISSGCYCFLPMMRKAVPRLSR